MMEKQPVIGVGTYIATPRAKELVLKALDANRLSYGPLSQEFESSFSAFHGCRFGVLSNSGTSALHVALATLKELHGWSDGDEILVPACTFIATSNVIIHNNLTPIFIDIERDYYGIDPAQIESRITPKTKAIIPVHLYGLPADMDPITDIANRYDLKVIEDSCETMFAEYKGRSVGSLGDIGCFSTYIAHLIVTGVGGLNTTNNPDYAIKLRSLVNHGRDSIYLSIDDDDGKTDQELKYIIERRFSFVSLGHSFRVTEMEAALGIAQLEEADGMIDKRRSNAQWLTRALSKHEAYIQLPQIRPDCTHSYMMFPIVLHEAKKNDLVQHLEENGIETRDMMTLIRQPVYKNLLSINEDDFPVSKWVTDNGFYIGCHHNISESDLEYISDIFNKFWVEDRKTKKDRSLLVLIFDEPNDDVLGLVEQIPDNIVDDTIALVPTVDDPRIVKLKALNIKFEVCNGDPTLFLKDSDWPFDFAVLFPANGNFDPRDIAKVSNMMASGHDMVVASRFLSGGMRRSESQNSLYRSLGNRFFTSLSNILFLGNMTDTISRFRAIRKERLISLDAGQNGYALLFGLSIQAMKEHWDVNEIPTREVITLSSTHKRQAWLSVVPMLMRIAKEWRSR